MEIETPAYAADAYRLTSQHRERKYHRVDLVDAATGKILKTRHRAHIDSFPRTAQELIARADAELDPPTPTTVAAQISILAAQLRLLTREGDAGHHPRTFAHLAAAMGDLMRVTEAVAPNCFDRGEEIGSKAWAEVGDTAIGIGVRLVELGALLEHAAAAAVTAYADSALAAELVEGSAAQ